MIFLAIKNVNKIIYINKYIITGIIADIGLSKKDILLNSIIGKKAMSKFINIVINTFNLLFVILNVLIKQSFEKNNDNEDVNINMKKNINTVIFSIEFIKFKTWIFLRTMYTG